MIVYVQSRIAAISCHVLVVSVCLVSALLYSFYCFFFIDTATTEIYTLSLHDALPIFEKTRHAAGLSMLKQKLERSRGILHVRSEEHTSELQSLRHLVCRLLLEKKKNYQKISNSVNKTATACSLRPYTHKAPDTSPSHD